VRQPGCAARRGDRALLNVQRSRGFDVDPVVDYRHSPHLAQWPLHDRLAGFILETLNGLPDTGAPPRVLEVGAGHGGYTELLLAAGSDVTVVEMSRPALQRLEARYGGHERLTAVLDAKASLRNAGDGYSLALCVSVLHHIPDYVEFLRRITRRLVARGALVTIEDPLWYPRVRRLTRIVDRSAYLAWRIGQGRLRQGVGAMVRRLRRRYPEARAEEIVYYHVVRQGVDEEAVTNLLAGGFARVEVRSYWSHHLAAIARAAERAGMANTFAVRATGRSA
jgi:SAM-dependent methyltransferase